MRSFTQGSTRYAYIFVSLNLLILLVFIISSATTLGRVDSSRDAYTEIVSEWYRLQLLQATRQDPSGTLDALAAFSSRIELEPSPELLDISERLSGDLSRATAELRTSWSTLEPQLRSSISSGPLGAAVSPVTFMEFNSRLIRVVTELREFLALQQRSIEILLYFLGATIVATIAIFLGVEIESERERRAANRIQLLAQTSIAAQESERTRISQALHDSLAQELSVALLEVSELKNGNSAPVQKSLNQRLRSAIDWTRHLAHELHPAEIEQVGLSGAINAYCRDVAANSDVNLDWDVSIGVCSVDRDVALNIYRIAQESLTNAIRHAHAALIVLRLDLEGEALRLTVSDDGVGFRHDGTGVPTRSRGIGLAGMRERANMMNADLSVVTEPGRGSEISLLVPSAHQGCLEEDELL